MAKIDAYLDPIGNTLTLWWGDKKKAYQSIQVSDTTRDDVVMVDKNNHPLGVEIIGLLPKEVDPSKQLSSEQMLSLLETGKINLSQFQLPSGK